MIFQYEDTQQKNIWVLAGVFWIFCSLTVAAQPIPKGRGECVIQTKDGMIFSGSVDNSDGQSITLKTPFGSLQIPLDRIERYNGDRFEVGKGIVREMRVSIDSTGDVTLEYLLPIQRSATEKTANILIEGKVLELQDLNGHPLSFVAKDTQGFTRCTINLPEIMLAAVVVKVLQKQAVKIENQSLQYSYRYVPNTDQAFHFILELPEGVSVTEAIPQTSYSEGNRVEWQLDLRRQEPTTFSLRVALAS